MKRFSKRRLLIGLLLFAGPLALIAASNFGTLLPLSDDASDLGSSTLEWRDAYIDGEAQVDTANVQDTMMVAKSNALKTLSFALTDPTASRDWAIFTTSRKIRVLRADLYLPSAPSGGTVALTLHSGASSIGVTTTSKTGSSTSQVTFASGAICTLTTLGGSVSNAKNGIFVLQYQDSN